MGQGNWEADKMLDVYIHDYMSKKGFLNSAKVFQAEAKVSTDPVAINAPGGFLYEWWSVFWDIFIARTNEKHSEVASSYIKTQQLKAREDQQHQQQQQLLPPPSAINQGTQGETPLQAQPSTGQQLQLQQLLQQRQLQQRRDSGNQLGLGNSTGGNVTNDILRQNHANMLTTKLYEEKLKHSQSFRSSGDQNSSLQDAALKRQLLASASTGGTAQLQGAQGGIQQNAASIFQSNRTISPLQMISPQQQNRPQQQQQPQAGSSGIMPNTLNEFHERRIMQLIQAKNDSNAGKTEGFTNIKTEPFGGLEDLTGQVKIITSPSNDQEMLLKQVQRNLASQNRMHHSQIQGGNSGVQQGGGGLEQQLHRGSGVHGPDSDAGFFGTGLEDGTNLKVADASSGKKRDFTTFSSPGQTAGNINVAGADLGDIQGGKFNLLLPGDSHNLGSPSQSNHLGDLDQYSEDPSLTFLKDQDEPHLQQSFFDSNKQSPAGGQAVDSKGFSFNEVSCLTAGNSKVVCCHFSNDGKLLASAGHDKKAVVWSMETMQQYTTLEEHTGLITDVRFSSLSTRLATSSFDTFVRVWDIDNSNFSLPPLQGHQTAVMSVDFHPTNEDLLASCDGDSEVRYWSVNQGGCTRVFKGATTQLRFQPRTGRLLAAAADSVVSIFDVEADKCLHNLRRHTKTVHSICWNANGEYVASVSEDSVRVWSLGPSATGECIHELVSSGNKYHSCVFHPKYPSLLVIGCYQSLELWNMVENKRMTVNAHDGLVASLAQCTATEMMASASHDRHVKAVSWLKTLKNSRTFAWGPCAFANTMHSLQARTLDQLQGANSLDEASFLRAVHDGDAKAAYALHHTKNVDLNLLSKEGLNPLIIALLGYGVHQNIEALEYLLTAGAKVSKRASNSPVKVFFRKRDNTSGRVTESKRISIKSGNALLVALELKSALYLKGWEYRYWDEVLFKLANKMESELEEKKLELHERLIPTSVQNGWKRVFETGNHKTIEVWTDGKYKNVLLEILKSNSRILKCMVEAALVLNRGRIDLSKTSWTVTEKLIEFLYTGTVESTFLERRGVDLFLASHKYGIETLRHYCELTIMCQEESWIKLLTAAVEADSETLELKCARSIRSSLQRKLQQRLVLASPFSSKIHPEGGPSQLFTESDGDSSESR